MGSGTAAAVSKAAKVTASGENSKAADRATEQEERASDIRNRRWRAIEVSVDNVDGPIGRRYRSPIGNSHFAGKWIRNFGISAKNIIKDYIIILGGIPGLEPRTSKGSR